MGVESGVEAGVEIGGGRGEGELLGGELFRLVSAAVLPELCSGEGCEDASPWGRPTLFWMGRGRTSSEEEEAEGAMTSETWLTTTTAKPYRAPSSFRPSATWFISAARSVILNLALFCGCSFAIVVVDILDGSRSVRKIAPIESSTINLMGRWDPSFDSFCLLRNPGK
jgi:hypothetical protein